jgi:prepilin-type N-terminal cleavage/methylation domain-containing protein
MSYAMSRRPTNLRQRTGPHSEARCARLENERTGPHSGARCARLENERTGPHSEVRCARLENERTGPHSEVRCARLESGVTLIEILIAVTLLSLLSTGVLISMRVGFNTMDLTDRHLSRNRRVVNTRRIIESEIDGFVYTLADFYPQPKSLVQVIFLEAEAQTMRFVTTYSLAEGWRGKPRLAEMQVIPGDRGEGVRLILNETPYTGQIQAGLRVAGFEQNAGGPQITRFQPVEIGPNSFVLADRLAFCRFSYLVIVPNPPYQLWQPAWFQQPVEQQRLPLGVRIEMSPLDVTGNDLHMSTVTVPLRVNRIPGDTRYGD